MPVHVSARRGKRRLVPKKTTKKTVAAKKPPQKRRPPDETHEEVLYLRYLIDNTIPICVRLVDDEEVTGTIEYYDTAFIRLTRKNNANLFIFKHDIKYFYELDTETPAP